MSGQTLQLQTLNSSDDYSRISIGTSSFCDDIWDLSQFIKSKTISGSRRKLCFSYIQSKDLKSTAKLYAYYCLGKVKPQTAICKINVHLTAFIQYAWHNNIRSFAEIDRETFLNFVSWLKNEYVQKYTGERVSHRTGYLYSYVVEDIIKTGQIKCWNVPKTNIFVDTNSSILWEQRDEKRKTKPIPENVFDKILYHAINTEKDILTKAGIIIQSQTGLRISEVLSIKQGCIKTTGDGFDYLEVLLSKTERGDAITHKVFCNDMTVNMVRELEDFTKSLRMESGLDELFIYKLHDKIVITIKANKFNNRRLKNFVKKWNIRDKTGELYPLHSHQFRATYVRELIKRNIPIAHIMKHFNHVSVEMTAHYLSLQQEEVKEIYADMILRPESKIAGLRAEEIRRTLEQQFHGKSEIEIDDIIRNLSKSMSFNTLPTGLCLYDFRRGNCSDGDGCFFYNCPNYITEIRFYPILKKELELMEKEMARYKELGRERDWQRQYVKWQYLSPLVEDLEAKMNEKN